MNNYIALLRAVNAGDTRRRPKTDLKSLCETAGFVKVRTCIASGNVVVESEMSEAQVKSALEASLEEYAGKPIGVLVRTGDEMAEVLGANPFPNAAPNQTVAIFLDEAPPTDTLDKIAGRNGEEIQLGKREIYVHFAGGMADSNLKIPIAKAGTVRNMNTVAKLAEMAAKSEL